MSGLSEKAFEEEAQMRREGFMSELPKWFEEDKGTSQDIPYINRLEEALSVAWEALEEIRNIGKPFKDGYKTSDTIVRETMRRIEEVGK